MGKHDPEFERWVRHALFGEDIPASKAARDEGMADAVDHAGPVWGSAVDDRVRQLRPDWIGTTEDIRMKVCPDLPSPGHVNAWGGKTTGWRNRGWLAEVGIDWAKTKDGHRRRVVKYRRTEVA